MLLPQFKVRDDADRGGFAQEATVKKKALPQQLRALDGHEGDAESAEDDEALARPENSVVVEPYEDPSLDEESLEPDEDLSEVSFAEEDAADEAVDEQPAEPVLDDERGATSEALGDAGRALEVDSEGTFELVDEVDDSSADAGADAEAEDVEPLGDEEESEPVFELVDEVEEEVEAPDAVSEVGEEEVEHLGTEEFDELLTQEGTLEVDEDAILESSTEESEPEPESESESELEPEAVEVQQPPAPPASIPPESSEEEDPWADLAEEVEEEEASETPRGEQEEQEEQEAPQDRDLSRRLRAGARDLLRHLRPPSAQAPTPEASSSGTKKLSNDPELFPREEVEEPVGLEQITRVAGAPANEDAVANIAQDSPATSDRLGDEESFSDIEIEELESIAELEEERGLDEQLSTVDRPLESSFASLDFEHEETSRAARDKQELIETAEQPAVERIAELSVSDLDDEFGTSFDFLGDGLSEHINESLGFSSAVEEELSLAEVVSIEEMETNEVDRPLPEQLALEEEPDEQPRGTPQASEDTLEQEEPPPIVLEQMPSEVDSSAEVVPEDVATAVRDALETLAGVPGLVAAALIDTDADACFDLLRTDTITESASWPAEAMLTASAASMRAQRDLLAGLGQLPNVEDVIFGVGSQHYILRPLDSESRWFLGLLGYTPRTNIALTRLLLGNACTSLGEILESILSLPASASRKTPTRA